MSVKETLTAIEKARAEYLAIVHTAPAAEVKAKADAVRDLQKELSAKICEGAKPCPTCGGEPHGMIQPKGNTGEVEFEVGCPSCGWFESTAIDPPQVKKDGDGNPVLDSAGKPVLIFFARDHGARGGLLPRHAVDAWNEGPEYWKKKTHEDLGPEKWAKAQTAKSPFSTVTP